MSLKSFHLVAGHPALDFVNTVNWRFRHLGAEDLLFSYEELLRFGEVSGLLTREQIRTLSSQSSRSKASSVLTKARVFREQLAELLYAIIDAGGPTQPMLDNIEPLFQRVVKTRGPRWLDGRLVRVWGDEIPPEVALWSVILSAATLLESQSDVATLKSCANEECRWLFLDQSKNSSRRWCDMALCGNRIKAKRFRDK